MYGKGYEDHCRNVVEKNGNCIDEIDLNIVDVEQDQCYGNREQQREDLRQVEKGAEVKESIVMPGATVKAGARLYKTIVGENAVIGEKAIVGTDEGKVTLIGPEAVVVDEATVEAGAIVGKEEAK